MRGKCKTVSEEKYQIRVLVTRTTLTSVLDFIMYIMYKAKENLNYSSDFKN